MTHGLPMLLSSSAVPLLDIPVPFDSRALQNKSRGPMLVEEISFLVRQTAVSPLAASCFWAKIEIAQHPITNGFVPVMCMGPPYDLACERIGGVGTPVYESFAMWIAANYDNFWSFRWRLPKPLFIPRGAAPLVSIFFKHDARWATPATPAANALRATVAIVGRSLSPSTKTPAMQDVPYVTAWVPEYVSGAFNRHSGELDLKNIFQSNLYVQRLIARAEAVSGTTGYEAGWAGSAGYPVTTKIKISTLAGEPLTRDPIQHSSLASDHALLWTLGKDFAPREGLQIDVIDNPGTTKLMYSIVGSRQERLWANV